jgi:zinc transporter ZupT
MNALISIGVFSIAPAVGCTIGLIVYDSVDGTDSEVVVEIIMALATGTIIYVIFFEILPNAKQHGATGFQQILAMVLGFGTFLPTLLLRK